MLLTMQESIKGLHQQLDKLSEGQDSGGVYDISVSRYSHGRLLTFVLTHFDTHTAITGIFSVVCEGSGYLYTCVSWESAAGHRYVYLTSSSGRETTISSVMRRCIRQEGY